MLPYLFNIFILVLHQFHRHDSELWLTSVTPKTDTTCDLTELNPEQQQPIFHAWNANHVKLEVEIHDDETSVRLRMKAGSNGEDPRYLIRYAGKLSFFTEKEFEAHQRSNGEQNLGFDHYSRFGVLGVPQNSWD